MYERRVTPKPFVSMAQRVALLFFTDSITGISPTGIYLAGYLMNRYLTDLYPTVGHTSNHT